MNIKPRKMIQVNLSTGDRKLVDTPPISVHKYLKTMMDLNNNADVYGVMYLPIDQELNDWMDSCD